eukprot:CAMPEP_0206141420 /NCGR_PEP_ID=MMETSP1473-20131121/12844_1 /ASSEMBLY_ACC=CAM_ASM_001109 /TAXON_ID=1461547 /ORGANISM="Stichococcus sp, Strain RCC1054" /LENGTH=229 /DNA_ID=CAMNT_0053535985 /DNA_START=36 /DNA_END=725 /DNA_ORIENTATION=-
MTDLVRLEQSMLPARLSAAFAIPMQGQDLIPTATAQAELSQRGALHPAGSLHPSAPGAWPAARPSLPDHPLQPGHAAWQGAFGFPQAFGAASDAAAAAAAAAAAQADRAVPQAPGAGYPSGHPEAVAATTGAHKVPASAAQPGSRPGDPAAGVQQRNESQPVAVAMTKKPRVAWTAELHKLFVKAVTELGVDTAVPKAIMTSMNVEGLTRENVASHLQKYRLQLKRGHD